jgi:hypothetical protein
MAKYGIKENIVRVSNNKLNIKTLLLML